MESTRVDRWLWAVRLCKTRSTATEACRAGHVRVNGSPAKAATTVRCGDRVVARLDGTERSVEVVQILDKRVGPPLAAAALIDHQPPAPREARAPVPFAREPAAGRPTKRDRRQMDRLRKG